MKLPPVTILKASATEALLQLDIKHGLEAFRDHFPDHPILPGVTQIDWVVCLAKEYLHLMPLSARDFQVKFREIIHPGTQITLLLTHDTEKMRLSFTYKRGDSIMSSGIVKLGSTT